MADEESGGGFGGRLSSILTRKVAGVPVYVYGIVLVLLLAWYMKKRAASSGDKPSDSAATDVGAFPTFPYASPMNYSSDVFVNNTIPPSQPTTLPAVQPGGTSTATPYGPPVWATVVPGWHVDQWILDLQAGKGPGGVGTTWTHLLALNPQIVNNINWHQNSKDNTFKTGASYRIQ